MTEPVLCPSCGQSYGVPPAGGKCTACGASIPTPASGPAKGINEEVARLGAGDARVCPTCGKPLPAGKRVCPTCRAAEPVGEHHHGWPGWLTLLLVLVGTGLVTWGVVVYTQKWGHDKHEGYVREELTKAREAGTQGRISDAVISIETARKQLDVWFKDDEDPTRSDLASEIERERKTLHANAEDRLKELIKRGDELEAKRFYEDEIKPIDTDTTLKNIVDAAVANREAVLKYRGMLKQAQKLHDDGSLVDALGSMHALRAEMQDPTKVKGDILGELRKTVDNLQTAWVKEAADKGNSLLDQGKLKEAAEWFEVAKQNVWGTEVAFRRKLDDTLSYIHDNRIAGAVVNVSGVRVVKPEEVKSQLTERLRTKLADENLLMLVVSGWKDPAASELPSLLVVDYKEEKGRPMTSATGEKATATKVTCTLKMISKDNKVLWRTPDPVLAQTGNNISGEGAFDDAKLRQNAMQTFWQAFDAVRLMGHDSLP